MMISVQTFGSDDADRKFPKRALAVPRLRRSGSLLLLVAVCFFTQASPAQEDAARGQIEAAEAAVGKAIYTQDFAALEKLWSPQMIVNSPNNDILTRNQVFAAMRQDQLKYAKYENTVESFHRYGEVGVLMGHEALVPGFGPEAGKTFYRRYTDVWQRADGSWSQISRQATYTTATDIYATAPEDTRASPDVDAGIKAFLSAWDAAFKAHDADAVLRLHAEDCITVNRAGRLFLDRASLTAQMERLQKQVFKDAQFPPLRIIHQRVLTPDLVTLQLAWQNPSGMPPPAPAFNDMILTFLLKRGVNGWLLEAMDSHDVEPLPPVAGQAVFLPNRKPEAK